MTKTRYEFAGPTKNRDTEVDCPVSLISMLVQLPLEIYKNLVQFYYKLCKSINSVDQRSELFELKMEVVWLE